MKTVSKVLVYVVLVGLLLSWLSGGRSRVRGTNPDHRLGHDRHRGLTRLRRCRDEDPAHHPVRPSKNAILPPDDFDDDDRARLNSKEPACRWADLIEEARIHALASSFGSRPLPPSVPRHQTFCLLLI